MFAAFPWRTVLGVVAVSGALAAALVVRRAARYDAALVALVSSLPHPAARLAVRATGATDAGGAIDPRRMETWPAAALYAAQVSVEAAGSRALAAVRLSAAVDFYEGRCANALGKLEEALRLTAPSAALLNDSSAAYLCLARESPESSGPTLARAIERALAAVDLQPDLPEPYFNLALAYEGLGLTSFAREALHREIACDDDRGWRIIASDHLRAFAAAVAPPAGLTIGELQRPIDRAAMSERIRQAQPTREWLELRGLAAWADAAAHAAPETAVIEANFRSFGEHRRAAFGDVFLHDVAESIRGGRIAAARAALIAGHAMYARGRAEYDRGERELAGATFAAARRRLAAAASPFEHEAHLQEAIVLYQLRCLEQARRAIDEVRERASRLRYRAIEARAHWMLGLIEMQEGRVERAVAEYQRAASLYEQLGEDENVVSVANTAADTLRSSGDRQRGWQLLVRAARGLPTLTNLQRQYLIVFDLSLYAQDEGLLRAAEAFQNAAIRSAEARGATLTIIESHLRRAQLTMKRAKWDVARDDIAAAGAKIATVASPMSAAYLTAWKARVEAALLQREDPRAASARLEALVDPFERTEPAEIPSLLLEASRSAVRAHDTADAVRLLRRAQRFIADRRTLLRTPEYRLTYITGTWGVFQDLIGLEFATSPAAALSIAETARRAAISDSQYEPEPVVSHRPESDDSALIYYASLEDRLLVWTITAQRATSRELPYGFDDLAADVDAYRGAIQARRSNALRSDLAKRIFERVVAPALDGLGPNIRRLLIAADGAVGDLPLSTLVDPQTGRFLFERYDLAFVPSLAAVADVADAGSSGGVLSVGFNGAAGTGFPLLHDAEDEARAVARIHPGSTLLIGASATASAVRRAAADRVVLHIAAHAQANRLLPWSSQLALAPEGDSRGSLDFDEIAAWDLRRCALVVLSACETATGARFKGQGVISLASPFLAAGAKVVVGTLWNIDDRGAEAFMRVFHGYVARREPPSRALRLAQQHAIASRDPLLQSPSVWGAYVVNTRVADDRARSSRRAGRAVDSR